MKNTILLTALFLTISNLAFSQTQQNDGDSINKSSIVRWFIDIPDVRLEYQSNAKKLSFLETMNFIQSKIEELQKIYDK